MGDWAQFVCPNSRTKCYSFVERISAIMSLNRKTFFPLALAIVLTLVGGEAFAKGGKNRKSGGDGAIRGTVTAVTSDSITIETRKRGTREFKLSGNTVFERVKKHGEAKPLGQGRKAGKKGKAGRTPKIEVGSRVVITLKEGAIEKVGIKRHHKKSGAAPEASPGTSSGSSSGPVSASSSSTDSTKAQ
jgi:hypothetical protein